MKERLFKEYGFHFPPDFWMFYEFVKELRSKKLYKDFFETVGMSLAGPFDFLDGYFDGKTIQLPGFMHWRYYMDPPEFFTILCGDCDGLHWGYWSDNPEEGKFVVAFYYTHDAYEISDSGNTLFEAVRASMEASVRSNIEYMEDDADYKDDYIKRNEIIAAGREILMKYETRDRPEIGEEYEDKYTGSSRKPTALTMDGMGIVVDSTKYSNKIKIPDDISVANLPILEQIAQKAIDDGFAGNALEIGKELWSCGSELEDAACKVLEKAYDALGRKVLKNIVVTHHEYHDNGTVDITKFIGKEFSSFEKAFKTPEDVVILNLYRKKLDKLPENIGEFKNLQKIKLFFNNITELPKSFYQLTNLTEIILSNNPIDDISDEIFNFKSLKTIYLSDTKISKERINEIKTKMPWAKVEK